MIFGNVNKGLVFDNLRISYISKVTQTEKLDRIKKKIIIPGS